MKLENVGMVLLVVAAIAGVLGAPLIWIGFKSFDEYRGLTEHLIGVRSAVGIWLIAVGVVTAIGGLLVKTKKDDDARSKGVIGELAGLLEHAGGLGLALVIVGALLLGMTFDTGDDRADAAPAPTATAP